MPHWRTFLDSDVIRFVDLSRDYAVRISKVVKGKVTGSGGKSKAKAMIYFEGYEKPLGAGTETLTQIAALYGKDTTAWVGQWITIWPDPSVKYGGDRVGGVRVRNEQPAEKDRIVPTKQAPQKESAA